MARRVTGQISTRRLQSGETAVYSYLRIPQPGGDYKRQGRLVGYLWTRGGRAPEGYVTRRQAEAILRERIVDAGRQAAEPEPEQMPTVAEVADDWLRGKSSVEDGVVNQTWRDYDSVLSNHLLRAFGSKRIDKVRVKDVADWKREALKRGMKARTVVRCLMVLCQVFTYAQREELIASNPASGTAVPRPSRKYDRSKFNVLEPAQVRAIADAMPTEHGRDAVLISAWTGVRQGELLELRWRDVAWSDERLHIRRSYNRSNGVKSTKSGHSRSVPMTPDLVALLDRLSQRDHSTGDDDLVLVDERGDRVNGWTLRRHYYEALVAAGLGLLRYEVLPTEEAPKGVLTDDPLVWHDLRHTFASHAARVMPSLSDVQALCGHAHITTTQRYVHYRPGADEAARLAAAFAEPDPLEQAVAQPARGAHRVPLARA